MKPKYYFCEHVYDPNFIDVDRELEDGFFNNPNELVDKEFFKRHMSCDSFDHWAFEKERYLMAYHTDDTFWVIATVQPISRYIMNQYIGLLLWGDRWILQIDPDEVEKLIGYLEQTLEDDWKVQLHEANRLSHIEPIKPEPELIFMPTQPGESKDQQSLKEKYERNHP